MKSKRRHKFLAAVIGIVSFLTPLSSFAQTLSAMRLNPLIGLGMTIDETRRNAGLSVLEPDAALRLAAELQARTMLDAGRAWPFSGGNAGPYLILSQSGASNGFIGFVVGETYQTLQSLLAEWLSKPASRGILMDRHARHIGIADIVTGNGLHWAAVFISE